MASAWLTKRMTASGKRYRVLYRTGGRDTPPRYAGSFSREREALVRLAWVKGELAAMRVPNLDLQGREKAAESLREACERWRASRIDVSEGTRVLHRVALARATAVLGDIPVGKLTTDDVARLIETLAAKGSKRETIKKTIRYLANVLDECGLDENPARDKHLRLPREDRAEVSPPTGEHVLAVHGSCRGVIGCRCSSSTPVECASANSSS